MHEIEIIGLVNGVEKSIEDIEFGQVVAEIIQLPTLELEEKSLSLSRTGIAEISQEGVLEVNNYPRFEVENEQYCLRR